MKTATRPTKRATRIPRALRQRAEQVLAGTYVPMKSVVFRRKNVEADLFSNNPTPTLPTVTWYQPTREEVAEAVSTAPQLMTPAEERIMFLRFNFAKVRLRQIQRRVAEGGLTRKLADLAVMWHERLEHHREYLTRTNLALVLAMAKRTRLGDVDFAEIVSEGNMALLRAVDKFNVDRGFKFSTYACRAILKAFSRTAMKHNRHRTRFPVEFEPDYEKSDWADRRRDMVEEDCLDELKQIVNRNLADLSSIEQTVIRRRFNWEQQDESPLTLEEVGQIIGVTKERVRQIQNKAMLKIRKLLEDGVLRTTPFLREIEQPAASQN